MCVWALFFEALNCDIKLKLLSCGKYLKAVPCGYGEISQVMTPIFVVLALKVFVSCNLRS